MRQIPHETANDFRKQAEQTDRCWSLLVQVAAFRRANDWPNERLGLWLSSHLTLVQGDAAASQAQLIWDGASRVVPGPALAPHEQDFVNLYLPLLAARADQPVSVAHLGQSVDSKIATPGGDSYYVTGPENLRHLHRMRALCDAVIVGAGTVQADNPRLTTRLVEGPNPVRVVIDPAARLAPDRQVFSDGQARTLRVCSERASHSDDTGLFELIKCGEQAGGLMLDSVLGALRARGLLALFVEGGGVTVSRWLAANLLDRLQIATAPLLVGPGLPALALPPAASMQACLRPDYQLYQMGNDVLWDFDLRGNADQPRSSRHGLRRLA